MPSPKPKPSRINWRTFWGYQAMTIILLRAAYELGYGAVAAVKAWPWWAGGPTAVLLALLCAVSFTVGLACPILGLVMSYTTDAELKAASQSGELYLPPEGSLTDAEPRRAASRAATRSSS